HRSSHRPLRRSSHPPRHSPAWHDTATTATSTLSLHDALPISAAAGHHPRSKMEATISDMAARASTGTMPRTIARRIVRRDDRRRDRKSTRLNSSHVKISYAVFCLKKKTKSKSTRLHPTQRTNL